MLTRRSGLPPVARRFSNRFRIAHQQLRGTPGGFGRHTGVEVGLDLLIEVEPQLLVELPIQHGTIRATRGASRRDDSASACQAFLSTSPIPADSRSHAFSSRASRFCPALVSR